MFFCFFGRGILCGRAVSFTSYFPGRKILSVQLLLSDFHLSIIHSKNKITSMSSSFFFCFFDVVMRADWTHVITFQSRCQQLLICMPLSTLAEKKTKKNKKRQHLWVDSSLHLPSLSNGKEKSKLNKKKKKISFISDVFYR